MQLYQILNWWHGEICTPDLYPSIRFRLARRTLSREPSTACHQSGALQIAPLRRRQRAGPDEQPTVPLAHDALHRADIALSLASRAQLPITVGQRRERARFDARRLAAAGRQNRRRFLTPRAERHRAGLKGGGHGYKVARPMLPRKLLGLSIKVRREAR
jgi:hypothetical protein